MKLLFTWLPLLVILFPAIGNTQVEELRGSVYDQSSLDPLIGASIVVMNTESGTVTDVNGDFVLKNVSIGNKLKVSYLGYEEKIIDVVDNEKLEIFMVTAQATLDEVLLIGYGKQQKKVATGAISEISAKNIEGYAVPDVSSALEGQVTGLMVNESSGQPGASKSLLIRGISTNGDNSPLYVVDGVQINDVNNINPSDIESVNILKDAASSAIYGARAANGVVIITTKRGSSTEGGTISYETSFSSTQPWRLPSMLGSDDYITLTREKYANSNQSGALETLGFPQVGDDVSNTNWMETIFNPATIKQHHLSATTKNAYLGFEYWDQNGVIGGDKSNYKRYSVRANSVLDINDYISIGENLYVNRTQNNSIGVNDAFGTVIADAFAYDPLTEVYNEDKQYGFDQSKWVQKEYINPLSRLFLSNNDGHADQIQGNVYMEIKPIKGLRLRSDLGTEMTWYNYRSFTPDYNYHEAAINPTNDVYQGYGHYQRLQFENYANYTFDIADKHNFDIVVGTSYLTTRGDQVNASTSSIPEAVKFNPNWQYISAGQDTTDLASGVANVQYHLISYFGRVIYDIDQKYLFTGTIRRDGSSNFGANNRWGIFPSFSAGWVISKEPFFNIPAISFMKLRASWGLNGNDRISPLSYASTIENVFTYAFGNDPSLITGSALATPPNPNVKWEESDQIDIGLELEFLEGQFSLEADVYRKTTRDLLMSEIIPAYIGATNNPISNLGSIRNQGVEIGIGHRLSVNKFRLNTRLSYTHFKNEVLEVAGEAGYLQGWSWPVRNTPITRMTEGFPVGHFVGYETAGIFQSEAEVFSHLSGSGEVLQPNAKPGDLIFVDVNGDGVISSDDITDIGSPWPDHIIGLSLQATYGGFDFSAVFGTQIGNEVFRAYERSDISYTNYQTFWLDRWTPENPSNEYFRLTSNDPNNNQRPSDFYVEDGSFLRLKNIQLGYNLPVDILSKAKIKALRLYITCNNLWTLTNYQGFDPDIGTNGWILDTGIDKGFYPSNKSFGGGLKITF